MSSVATLDASHLPDLRRIAEEVRESRAPVVLRLDGRDVAIITPVLPADSGKVGVLTTGEFETLMSAAGGWKDIVDVEALKDELRQSRGQAKRSWET
ncbi:MAG TPA: hypothetical protein VH482_36440 [Thermomicrobiales bacterium]|jgi:hypothetical protein